MSSQDNVSSGRPDTGRRLVEHLPAHARDAVMYRNGIQTYHLPESVPALTGQTKVW
jgi:hypothetical protein